MFEYRVVTREFRLCHCPMGRHQLGVYSNQKRTIFEFLANVHVRYMSSSVR